MPKWISTGHRFLSKRILKDDESQSGLPKEMISDNGTSFVGEIENFKSLSKT